MDTINSKMKIGNISIDCTQRFSKKQKEHWKEYFGIVIEDVSDTKILFSAIVKSHWLNIRSDAGTDFNRIDALKYNDKIRIVQTKLIYPNKWESPQLWGKIAVQDKKTLYPQEWICLEYCNIIDD